MSNLQFNLLPDVKLAYVKAQQTKQKVISLATLIAIVSAAVLFLLIIFVYGLQKKQLNDAAGQIKAATAQVQSVSGLNQALTVQNQLQTLVTLNSNKQISSRIFGYLYQLTPNNITISDLALNLDPTANKMTIDGTADSQATVNTFIDTLKFTTYTAGAGTTAKNAFSSIVETGFSINPSNISYSLSMQFDPTLFANNLTDTSGKIIAPSLQIPSQSTTRSTSNALFGGGQ